MIFGFEVPKVTEPGFKSTSSSINDTVACASVDPAPVATPRMMRLLLMPKPCEGLVRPGCVGDDVADISRAAMLEFRTAQRGDAHRNVLQAFFPPSRGHDDFRKATVIR